MWSVLPGGALLLPVDAKKDDCDEDAPLRRLGEIFSDIEAVASEGRLSPASTSADCGGGVASHCCWSGSFIVAVVAILCGNP